MPKAKGLCAIFLLKSSCSLINCAMFLLWRLVIRKVLVDLACHFVGTGYRVVVDELEGGLVLGCDRLDGIYIYVAHLNIT